MPGPPFLKTFHSFSAQGTLSQTFFALTATNRLMMDKSDSELIEATLAGQTSAWDILVRRHEGRVYNLGLRLVQNPDDALDLVQEVFLGVYRNLARFRGEAQFSTWLFRVVHNKAIDLMRRRQASGGQCTRSNAEADHELDFYPDAASDDSNPQHQYLEAEQNRQINTYLGRLSTSQRVIVELKVFQSLTFDDIAESQNISANTAKTRYYAALKNLRTMMETQS